MAFLEPFMQQDFVITRESSEVYSKDPAIVDDDSLGISVSPSLFLRVTLANFTTGSGTVTLTGEDENSDPVTEVFTFPSNGRLVSDNKYSSLSRVQTSGLTNEATVGKVVVESVTEMGELQPSFVSVATIRGRLARPEQLAQFTPIGEQEMRKATIITKDTGTALKVGDKLVAEGDDYEIEEIQPRYYKHGGLAFRKLIINELESPAE